MAARSRPSERHRAPQDGPLTIRLPAALRRRAERYARSRDLQLAGAIRVILSEHLDELEGDEQMTRAERWQRDQAWATARSIVHGTAQEVTWEDIQAAAVTATERGRSTR